MDKESPKRCIDCSTSQQIKCFGIEEVSRGIGKNRKCNKTKSLMASKRQER